MASGAEWRLDPIRVVKGFDVPESVHVDRASGYVYVSNVATSTRGFWKADGEAWVSRVKLNGDMDATKWRASSRAFVFDAPKGLCAFKGVLYAADITCVRAFSMDPKQPARTLRIEGAQKINDVATDGRAVYVSDTARGVLVRLDLSEAQRHAIIPGPAGANGIAFHRGKCFVVSWPQHEVFEVDIAGRFAPEAFGLARHFTNLDGIVVLEDGTFIVSDFIGGKVCSISPDRKTVRTLAKIKDPADIDLDRQTMRLFVPQFNQGQAAIFQLVRK